MSAIVIGLPLLYAAVTIGEGWVRAPRIVARQLSAQETRLMPESLPPERLRMLLAVEDPAFYSHHGVDLRTPGAGMTTITQGLVKFLYFERFRPGIAKIRQSLLAIGFDARTGKHVQLAIFLNSAYLGTHGGKEVLGFENAARAYFGKPLADLSEREFLSLVAMCIAPNAYNVAAQPERNSRRVARIEKMLRGECRPAGWRDVQYEACR